MQTLLKTQEFYLIVVVVLLSAMISIINPAFLTYSNLFDLCKSSVVMGTMALGVLLVLISGGIDISFTAIAAVSMYVTTKVLLTFNITDSFLIALMLSSGIGLLLGLLNAYFISVYNLPTLIVTLGTASLFRGFMLAFIGTEVLTTLPNGMIRFSKAVLFERTSSTGAAIGLSISFVLFLLMALAVAFMLRYTMTGRAIYAMGGHREAADRVGFRCKRIEFVLYGFVGVLSGIAGLIHACLMRNANPFDLVGMELVVIAAVVLGGASIVGGRGSVLGTVLGVLLLVIMNNSLILLDIPTYYQKVAIGLIIIVSTAVTARRGKG